MDQATTPHASVSGTSEKAVRIQIWSAIAVYQFVAILTNRLHLEATAVAQVCNLLYRRFLIG